MKTDSPAATPLETGAATVLSEATCRRILVGLLIHRLAQFVGKSAAEELGATIERYYRDELIMDLLQVSDDEFAECHEAGMNRVRTPSGGSGPSH